MMFVLDASVLASLLIVDEHAEAAARMVDGVERTGCVVPDHTVLEVITVVLRSRRVGRLDSSAAARAMSNLARFFACVDVDLETTSQAIEHTTRLAERHQLSAYDAAYLELAQRRGVALATLDDRLIEAARRESVALVGG